MADIGGLSCNTIKGTILAPTERVATHQVPGIDGVAAQLLGLSASPFSLRVMKRGTVEDLDTWITAMEAKKGVLLTITDDFDNGHSNCLIDSMVLVEKKAHRPANMSRCVIRIGGTRS